MRRDAALAAALAALFAIVWSWRGWGDLSALRLPDTDDAMRLQQVRDWLSGQPFADLSQHRLAGGLPMHWSRLPDLPLALLIRSFGEVAAVIVWPPALFAAALLLTARIVRQVGAPVATTMLVAALAYPATALFLPGRIDHHGLQLVLLLGMTLGLLGPAGRGRGIAVGTCVALGLLVGLETAPLAAVGLAIAALEWRAGHKRRLDGVVLGYGATLFLGWLLLRPALFDWPGCDGFTAIAFRAEAIGAVALALLALAGRSRLPRTAVLAGVAVGSGVAVLLAAPGCLAPYGDIDPLLAHLWLANVAEAQPLFAVPLATLVAQGGLALVGLVAALLVPQRRPGSSIGPLATGPRPSPGNKWVVVILQAAAVLLACVQLRAVAAAALLAAPALATLIAAARTRGPLALTGGWLASAGIVYPFAAAAFDRPAPAATAATDCRAAVARLATLPPALVVGPPDLGAWGIAATRHRFLAAPYHRNNAGNRAAYTVLLGDEAAARGIVARTGTAYVVWCGGLGGVTPPAASLAARIGRGDPPDWLREINDGVLAVVPGAR